MYWFIGVGVKNSIDIMVEATAVNTLELTCLESYHTSTGNVFFDGDSCPKFAVTANFGPFCSKDFSSGASSFLDRFIIHLSHIVEEVEGVTAMLKVLVILQAILEVVEALEIRCLSFLI